MSLLKEYVRKELKEYVWVWWWVFLFGFALLLFSEKREGEDFSIFKNFTEDVSLLQKTSNQLHLINCKAAK